MLQLSCRVPHGGFPPTPVARGCSCAAYLCTAPRIAAAVCFRKHMVATLGPLMWQVLQGVLQDKHSTGVSDHDQLSKRIHLP
jgi:hypothetical protein